MDRAGFPLSLAIVAVSLMPRLKLALIGARETFVEWNHYWATPCPH